MEKYTFNSIIDKLAELYGYEYEKQIDGKFKQFDKQTEETEIINGYLDIVQFYLEQYQNKAEISGGNEYEKIIKELKELLHK